MIKSNKTLKKNFERAIITESAYFRERVNRAMAKLPANRHSDYFAKLTKMPINNRQSQRTNFADSGYIAIAAILGKKNCVVAINVVGAWFIVWQDRMQYGEWDNNSYKGMSLYLEAVAAGASVHEFSNVLNEI